jgi:hypothetical protein
LIEIRPPAHSPPGESPGSGKAWSRLPDLAKHEIIQGRVLRSMTDQGTVIAIKDRQVIARSQVPLEPDQLLLLRVEELSPTPLLRLLGIVGRSAGVSVFLEAAEQNLWQQVLENLGRSVTAGTERDRLRALLKELSVFFGKQPGRESLRDWIGKSGMIWENKLRSLSLQGRVTPDGLNRLAAEDLKGLLAGMVRKEEGTSPLIEKLLKVIENLQWLNHQGLSQAGKIFLLIPFRFPDGFWTVAHLLIQKVREEETSRALRKGKSCRAVVLTELPSLGRVRAEVMIEMNDVRIAFLAENDRSGNRLRELLPFLIDRLLDRGFRVREATCEVRDPDFLRQGLVHELSGMGAYSFSTVA